MSTSRMERLHSIFDVHALAKRRVPRFVMDYLDGGADTERAVRHNTAAFGNVVLTPRYLVDASECRTSVELFGRRWSMPIGIAPTGLAGLVAPSGDIHRARAAREADVPFLHALASTDTIEEVAAEAKSNVWLQLNPLRDDAVIDDLLARAQRAGVEVLVMTVDVPTSSKRLRDLRNGLDVPIRPTPAILADMVTRPSWTLSLMRHGMPELVNLKPYVEATASSSTLLAYMASQNASSFDWHALTRIRKRWRGPLVLKGLMDPRDVAMAVTAGMDGVIVSNHGGRQFDANAAPIEVLAVCCDAADGRIPVLIDSGIRHGLDVVRALALGANFTFVGRPSVYGLAAASGQKGVDRVLAILRDEMERALRQLGCPDISALDRTFLGGSGAMTQTADMPARRP